MAACFRCIIWVFTLFKSKKIIKLNGNVFNFGPSLNNNFRVIDVLNLAKKSWNKVFWKIINAKKNVYESNLLKLNSSNSKIYFKMEM